MDGRIEIEYPFFELKLFRSQNIDLPVDIVPDENFKTLVWQFFELGQVERKSAIPVFIRMERKDVFLVDVFAVPESDFFNGILFLSEDLHVQVKFVSFKITGVKNS